MNPSIPEVTADIAGLINVQVRHSERLRAAALLAISALLLAVIGLVSVLPGGLPPDLKQACQPALLGMAGVLLALSVWELIILMVLRHRQTQPQAMPESFRFANAMVECLVPTLLIWTWSGPAGPLQAVGGVLSWLYFPFIAVSALHLNPRLCWFTGIVSSLAFFYVASLVAPPDSVMQAPLLVSSTSFGLKSLLLLICGAVAAFVASQLRGHLISAVNSARDRDRAIGIFGQHVSPQVARRLIEQPADFTAEQRHVCVLFLDIRGFSTMAAQRTPAQVMQYLNELFTPMITLVNQHGGIVNKFLGDGFMAIFGAPFEDPELHRNAVHCALALRDIVSRLNTSPSFPHTRIGIGLHAGDAMAGTVGSDERKEYTLLGDTVNAAARIEQETKKHGVEIIASDAVLAGMNMESFTTVDLGECTLRGISQPLRLYQVA